MVAWKKNVTTFGADMSSSVHFVNKGKVILILVERPAQGLDDTTLIAETKCLQKVYIITKKIPSKTTL